MESLPTPLVRLHRLSRLKLASLLHVPRRRHITPSYIMKSAHSCSLSIRMTAKDLPRQIEQTMPLKLSIFAGSSFLEREDTRAYSQSSGATPLCVAHIPTIRSVY